MSSYTIFIISPFHRLVSIYQYSWKIVELKERFLQTAGECFSRILATIDPWYNEFIGHPIICFESVAKFINLSPDNSLHFNTHMKTYIISGGGSGIGRAIAQKLSAEYTVILCGRSLNNLEESLSSLENPSRHKILKMDIRSLQSIQDAVRKFPCLSLDGIIANAGIGGANFFGPDDRWNDIVETNLSGTYYFVNSFLPLLRKSSSEFKHITIVSSILARLGVSKYSAYCASKAGLLGLMRSWAMEMAPEKILVNAICPGWVNTKMAQDGLEEIAQGLDITKDQFYQIAMQSVPLGKMSEPEEVAGLISYLLQQKSMTGQTLDINNGAIMNS